MIFVCNFGYENLNKDTTYCVHFNNFGTMNKIIALLKEPAHLMLEMQGFNRDSTLHDF